MKLKLELLGNRAIVEKTAEEPKKAGTLILPDDAKITHVKAEVLAVGQGVMDSEGKFIKPSVKVGDKVLLSKHSGQEIKLEEKTYYLVQLSDIVALVS